MTNSDVNMVCNNVANRVELTHKNAHFGRFFICACLFFCLSPPLFAGDKADLARICANDNFDQDVAVKTVIDGDTVILSDNRHVRLIGINTPEIGHNGEASQPGAKAAREFLVDLFKTNKSLRLKYDRVKTDKYGRTLAHLFLPDGTSLESLILQRGLATTLTIPPDLDLLDCYQQSQQHAIDAGIGLWTLEQYQAIPVSRINRQDTGYRIISGVVKHVGESRTAIWINLTDDVVLKINRENLQYFGPDDLHNLPGKDVIARGWLYYFNHQYRMQIHHPVDLKLVN